jgi:hypothetical protein
MKSRSQSQYDEDIECITGEKNGRGAIFLGNLEAAQNIATLSSIPTHDQFRAQYQGSHFDRKRWIFNTFSITTTQLHVRASH